MGVPQRRSHRSTVLMRVSKSIQAASRTVLCSVGSKAIRGERRPSNSILKSTLHYKRLFLSLTPFGWVSTVASARRYQPVSTRSMALTSLTLLAGNRRCTAHMGQAVSR